MSLLNDYFEFKNTINKSNVLKHLKSLKKLLATAIDHDVISGEPIKEPGLLIDGPYKMPRDFIHYYETYDIGIPYEYEKYLKEKGIS